MTKSRVDKAVQRHGLSRLAWTMLLGAALVAYGTSSVQAALDTDLPENQTFQQDPPKTEPAPPPPPKKRNATGNTAQDADKGKAAAQEPISLQPKQNPPAGESKGNRGVQIPGSNKVNIRPADKTKSAGCGDKGTSNPTPSATGPQPLWVCKETKCVLEPVWRGEKAVFTFVIGNEGEGDLNIKLKGG